MNDLIDRIQHAQTRAAEDLVVKNLQRQGLAPIPVDQPVTDDELPNNGPRVKPDHIAAQIASERYFTAGEGCLGEWQFRRDTQGASATPMVPVPPALQLLTLCVLVLKNGFTIVGQSACASPDNFDAGIGQRIAREHAVSQIGPYLGFRLRDRLAAEAHAAESPDFAPGSIV